jgi:hypothetical protein
MASSMCAPAFISDVRLRPPSAAHNPTVMSSCGVFTATLLPCPGAAPAHVGVLVLSLLASAPRAWALRISTMSHLVILHAHRRWRARGGSGWQHSGPQRGAPQTLPWPMLQPRCSEAAAPDPAHQAAAAEASRPCMQGVCGNRGPSIAGDAPSHATVQSHHLHHS